jgi:hypothetical protein
LCLLISTALFASLPVIDITIPPELPDESQASVITILTAWSPNTAEYKELAKDPKMSIEDFNVLAILQSKSGVSMKDMWRWRKLHLGWQEIVEKVKLSLDDVIPRSEKKWPEPYLKCWSYWRERGNSKEKISVADYDYEKLAEALTLQKASSKTIDIIVEQLAKGESFRSLSAKYLAEKTPKSRRK